MYKVLTFIAFISIGFANQTNCLDRESVGPETQRILAFYREIGQPISNEALYQAQKYATKKMLEIKIKAHMEANRWASLTKSDIQPPIHTDYPIELPTRE